MCFGMRIVKLGLYLQKRIEHRDGVTGRKHSMALEVAFS